MVFLRCLLYLALSSFAVFLIGRIIPAHRFDSEASVFRFFDFEKGGKFYDKFKIKKWKGKLPDMSKIFIKSMPGKCLDSIKETKKLYILVQETCVAEFSHLVLCISGFGCMRIWEGIGGLVVSILYMIGNIPFIMVQRYNRCRFKQTLDKMGAVNTFGEEEMKYQMNLGNN